jgi:hypothetical protein
MVLYASLSPSLGASRCIALASRPHNRRIAHPLPVVQHSGRDEHHIAARWIYCHLPRHVQMQAKIAYYSSPQSRIQISYPAWCCTAHYVYYYAASWYQGKD